MIRPFLDAYPRFDDSNFIASSAEVIGNVTLGHEASIWFQAVVRGDVNWIRIGDGSNVQDGAVVHVTHETAPTDIGAGVTIAHNVTVHGCHLEDDVLVGMGATVMDHATVGTESIVGAGALVTGGTEIPPRSLALGQPAEVARELSDAEVERIRENAEHYRRYSAIYRGDDEPDENPFYEGGPQSANRGSRGIDKTA
jgi:carbonic anhydrase/acetyltransferase-like protein (isoleucine patch superfamily)